jgi:hypothetical protein
MPSDRTLLHAAGQAYAIPDAGGAVPPWTPLDAFGNPAGASAGGVPWTQNPRGVAVGAKLDDAGMVGSTADGVVISLRGTRTYINLARDPLDWISDWVNNLAIVLTHDAGAPAGELSHGGFRLSANHVAQALAPQIREAVDAAPADAPIFVTGHSKGGAMAPFVARWLLANGYGHRKVVVRTFAAPRLCDGSFRAAYLASGIDHLRYEAFGDVVPLAPLAGPLLAVMPAAVLAKADIAMNAGYVDLGPGRYITPSGQLMDASMAHGQRVSDLTSVALPGGPTIVGQHSIAKGSTYAAFVPS